MIVEKGLRFRSSGLVMPEDGDDQPVLDPGALLAAAFPADLATASSSHASVLSRAMSWHSSSTRRVS